MSWAFGLLLGLAVAVLMLGGLIIMGVLLALDLPLNQYKDISIEAFHHYPQPNLGALFLVWLSMVLPALLVVYSLSFGLVTLMPKRAGLVKAFCVFSWILGGFYWIFLGDNADFAEWHLNYLQMTGKLHHLYQSDYNQTIFQTADTNAEIRFQIANQIEQKLYDIWTWQFPHLIYIGLSLALVGYLAVRYQRHRGN